MQFYKSPLSPIEIRQDKTEKCNLGDSISQHLMIILCTRLGELPSLPDYGCKLWDYQFELVHSQYAWETDVSETLEETIQKYERRLSEPEVNIHITEVEVSHAFRKHPDVKKKARIHIKALISQTKEPYTFATDLFISPMSK